MAFKLQDERKRSVSAGKRIGYRAGRKHVRNSTGIQLLHVTEIRRRMGERAGEGQAGNRTVKVGSDRVRHQGPASEKMLIYESGRSDYRKISDIDLCTEIDRNIVPRYGKVSVYHLSRTEKQQIAEFLYRQYHIGEAQIRRCLAI